MSIMMVIFWWWVWFRIDSFCKFTKLKGLQLRQEFHYIPSCIANLQKLETVEIDFWVQDKFIPELLALPELREIALGYTNFTPAGFLGLGSKNDPVYNTTELSYHQGNATQYFLTYSRICNDYFHPSANKSLKDVPQTIIKFIEDTNACDTVKSYDAILCF